MKQLERRFEIKKGDMVKMVPPMGREFRVGGSSTTGFRGGIVPPMVNFVEGRERFLVKEVHEDTLELVGSAYVWDKTWFEKVENKKEEEREMKCEFKVGDKVRLVEPKGKKFKAGLGQKDFKGCVVKPMVDIVEKQKVFEIVDLYKEHNMARFKDVGYVWDLTWFEKVEKAEFKKPEVKSEDKVQIKNGDKVKLVVPKGKTLRAGVDGFRCGLVQEMVDILEKNNGMLTVYCVSGDILTVEEDDRFFNWDADWFEVVDEKRVITDKIELEFEGKSTKATYGGKTGRAYRSKDDAEDRRIGVLVATMKALGFEEEMVSRVVDVLFDDVKELKDFTLEELLKEVASRLS